MGFKGCRSRGNGKGTPKLTYFGNKSPIYFLKHILSLQLKPTLMTTSNAIRVEEILIPSEYVTNADMELLACALKSRNFRLVR